MKKTLALIAALATLAALALSAFSCDSKFDRLLNPEWVKAITLVDNNGAVKATLSESDKLAIAKYVALLEFDAAFNNNANAMRMTAPDYSLVFSYKAEGATDETVRIWKSGRTWLRDQYYNLRAKDLNKAMSILSKY